MTGATPTSFGSFLTGSPVEGAALVPPIPKIGCFENGLPLAEVTEVADVAMAE